MSQDPLVQEATSSEVKPVAESLPVQQPPQSIQPRNSMAAMLEMAVKQNLGVEGIKTVSDLVRQERLDTAEALFNESFIDARRMMPVIPKNKTVRGNKGEVLYKFADLPQIMEKVDPILHAHGMTYSWDVSDASDNRLTVTCTLHHVSGHKRSSTFLSKPSGTSMMSANQISGAGITFGKRYSLCGVLGITTDEDTDAVEQAKPEADKSQPKVATRTERAEAEKTPAPPAPILAIGTRWQAWQSSMGTLPADPEAKKSLWTAWVKNVCQIPDGQAFKATPENLDKLDLVLKEVEAAR